MVDVLLILLVHITNNIHVVIWHRNHLPVLSNNPVLLSSGAYNYDFTASVDQAYGGSDAQKDLGGGIFGMYAGDADTDGTIGSER